MILIRRRVIGFPFQGQPGDTRLCLPSVAANVCQASGCLQITAKPSLCSLALSLPPARLIIPSPFSFLFHHYLRIPWLRMLVEFALFIYILFFLYIYICIILQMLNIKKLQTFSRRLCRLGPPLSACYYELPTEDMVKSGFAWRPTFEIYWKRINFHFVYF